MRSTRDASRAQGYASNDFTVGYVPGLFRSQTLANVGAPRTFGLRVNNKL